MSTTEYSPAIYAGDPHQVFMSAIAAKTEGHLSPEEFRLLIEAARSTIPTQTVTAHPIDDAPNIQISRTQLLFAWLRQRPALGALLIIITLLLAFVALRAVAAFAQVASAWLSLHVVSIGVIIVLLGVFILAYKTLALKSRQTEVAMVNARRPMVVRERDAYRGDEA